MTKTSKTSTITTSINTFYTSRILPFSPAAIYGAFASAEQLSTWWGPAGFTNSFELFEFKPQGRWHFVMQGPDGQQYPNRSFFAELEPNRKIVIRHDCAPFFTLTVELTPLADKTELRWLQVFDDADIAQAVRHIVEPANEQNLDRLTHLLSGLHSAASVSAATECPITQIRSGGGGQDDA